MKKVFRLFPALGLLGFLGITGFFLNPFFCVFFGFFGFFFWGLLGREKADERLQENMKKAESVMGKLALMLCFFLLFALDKDLPQESVLFWGSIGYAIVFTLAPAAAYVIDKRGA